jgi:fucose 4-O-acetylase-like acetyltransferase
MNHYLREPDQLGGGAVSALEQLAAWWATLVTALHTWWFVPAAVVMGLAMLLLTRLGHR